MSEDAISKFIALLGGAEGAVQALTDDALLRTWGAEELEGHRPAARVAQALAEEWASLSQPRITEHSRTISLERVVVEFRVHTTTGLTFRKQERCAVIGLTGDLISTIDMYSGPWMQCGPLDDFRAPAGMSDDELREFLVCIGWDHYMRRTVAMNQDSWTNIRRTVFGSGDAHPGANHVFRANFIDKEIDGAIEELIERHKARDIGFSWTVGPWDSPANLGERLEAHGLLRAGDQAMMVRLGLNATEIPVNPDLEIRMIGPDDTDLMDAALDITAVAFKWPAQTVEDERPDWYFNHRDPEMRKRHFTFVGFLDGRPVAEGILNLRSGIAYLGGAATLPEMRLKRVYSTLLRHRLLIAHEMGYNVAVIHAEPMSRRVVSRYGFKTYAMFDVYAWMPVMDPAVIATLVQDD